MHRLSLGLLFLAVIFSGCGYKHRQLVNPRVDLSAKTPLPHIQKTVARVLKGIGWRVESEKEGATIASFQKGAHMARISVDYTDSEISIRHLESNYLNYREKRGVETIHSRYMVWAKHVAKNLSKALNGVTTRVDHQ